MLSHLSFWEQLIWTHRGQVPSCYQKISLHCLTFSVVIYTKKSSVPISNPTAPWPEYSWTCSGSSCSRPGHSRWFGSEFVSRIFPGSFFWIEVAVYFVFEKTHVPVSSLLSLRVTLSIFEMSLADSALMQKSFQAWHFFWFTGASVLFWQLFVCFLVTFLTSRLSNFL